MPKPRRIRDPVHDLIPFGIDRFEQTAWKLLELPEFQRLRRIKQLGFTELVFPGATHTRFAHSVGVFHTARQLAHRIKIAVGDKYNEERAQVSMAAALVHDLGHGPFSHAFEAAISTSSNKKNHEAWTAEIVTGSTGVNRVLESFRPRFSKEVADVIISDTPADIYASIVSSQFDADRRNVLDVLKRYSAVELELAATTEFLKRNGYANDPWTETKRRKASKVDDSRVARSKQLLQELDGLR